jgi:hypothetical protein
MPSTPPSIHLADPLLHPFLSPTFSPTAYLNSTLPPLTPSKPPSQSSTSKPTPPISSALATQTQSQIAALSARTTTLSDTLTALTDEILRCSSRLTYEVELLRGEAVGLVEAMTSADGELGSAIRRFVPNGFESEHEVAQQTAGEEAPSPQNPKNSSTASDEEQAEEVQTKQAIERLRTLQHVRSLLQRTTQTFNSALSFSLPPSLLASSLIAINPPPSDPNAEEKGQAALLNLKREIAELLALDEGGARGSDEGLKTARERVAALREVVGVWKGTGEERARMKVVEGLEGMVEERRRVLDVGGGARREQAEARTGGGGRGFLGGLQRLREEIYME